MRMCDLACTGLCMCAMSFAKVDVCVHHSLRSRRMHNFTSYCVLSQGKSGRVRLEFQNRNNVYVGTEKQPEFCSIRHGPDGSYHYIRKDEREW